VGPAGAALGPAREPGDTPRVVGSIGGAAGLAGASVPPAAAADGDSWAWAGQPSSSRSSSLPWAPDGLDVSKIMLVMQHLSHQSHSAEASD
jgi:hypothetical protein